MLKNWGIGLGRGLSINIRPPEGTSGKTYSYMFKAVVSRFIQMYKPEFIISQSGVDGCYQDPLVELSLSMNTYKEVAWVIRDLANRYSNGNLSILVGGGDNTCNSVRCRSVMFATIAETLPKRFKSIID